MALAIKFHGDKKFREKQAEELIKKGAKAAMARLAKDIDASVDITLVGGEEIAQINREYRDKPVVTDVLSFPLLDMINGVYSGDISQEADLDTGKIPLGDMFICVERAREQAADFGHSFERECAYLTVHSILHLLGFDHEAADVDRVLMRQLEEEIMKNIGLQREGATK